MIWWYAKGEELFAKEEWKGATQEWNAYLGDQPYLLSVTSTEKLLNYKTHTLTRPLLLVASVITHSHGEWDLQEAFEFILIFIQNDIF